MKRITKLFIKIILVLILISILWVFAYKWINPPISTIMIHRNIQNNSNLFYKPDYKWIELNKISENIILTIIASEDNNFFVHNGFEWQSIREAEKDNKTGKRIRGGSTISQQCAKNIFLWPHKHYIRKGIEVWFTFLIENIWGKERILEVYLNVIETGKGIYGIESASQNYFNCSCSKISRKKAAYIAAILPNPRNWNAKSPGPYVKKRHKWILKNSENIYPYILPYLKNIE